jgi:cytochrome P450
LRETLRFEPLIPTFVHTAMQDTKLCGYDIPESTLVFPGLYALHFDKETWGDPDNFRPERFLENGKLSLKADKSLPFGAGRRLCAGETFSRNTMFLCLTAILQNFNLKPSLAQNGKFPGLNETGCGLARTPNDFWLRLEAR